MQVVNARRDFSVAAIAHELNFKAPECVMKDFFTLWTPVIF